MNLLKNTLALCLVLFLFVGGSFAQKTIEEKVVCPAKMTKITSKGDCGTTVDYVEPFSEVESHDLVKVQNNYTPKSYFSKGESTVYYKGTDAENNNYFCIFKVKVKDMEKPYFTEFPSEVFANATEKNGAKVFWKEPAAEDNCETVSILSSHQAGDFFSTGSTVVTYWAYDESGNYTSRELTVTVGNNETLVSASR